jgi:epoxide hydrolase-like predicted phosphatase
MMIKAIIFDLNGVFIQSERLSDRFNKDYNVKTQDFLPVLNEIMGKVRQPNAGNLYEYWKPYLEQWHVNLSESQFYDYWFSAETENKELVDLAKEIRGKGIKLIILSNNFKERTNYYLQTFPDLFKMFDRVYFSWQTGFVKPDARAFDLLFSENNLKPDECLYFDDGEKNVELGNSLGIKSYIFTNAEGVSNLL